MNGDPEKFLKALKTAGIDLHLDDVADALWLTRWTATGVSSPAEGASPDPPPAVPAAGPTTETGGEPGTSPVPAPAAPLAPAPPSPEQRVPVHLARSGRTTAQGGGRTLVASAARALTESLALLKALRPLRRRVAARGRWEIDEDQTIRRVAEEDLWLPVMRLARERWLRLSLVADAAVSMGVWRQTIQELYRLLLGCGTFFSVRLWSLDLARDPARLYPGLAVQADRQSHDLRELFDPSGRSALLILSDAVGPEWYASRTANLLAEWARRMPVALVQMLLEHLWERTGLGFRDKADLYSTGVAVPSSRLRAEVEEDWLSRKKPKGVPLPVLVLEPASLSSWARALAGDGDARLPGVLLNSKASGKGQAAAESETERTPEDRVAQFEKTATDNAWQLAGLLAAAPAISLPILRLIRQEMLPGARQSHEAEVLLGGLLTVVEEDAATGPDGVLYGFYPGVRERLLDAVKTADTVKVLECVSGYIEKHLHRGFGLQALLPDPASAGGKFVADDTSFARVAASVLQRLGGDYARLVSAIPSEPPPSPAPEEPALPPAKQPPAAPTVWVCVSGTVTDQLSAPLLEASRVVGRILAEEGYGLQTGGYPGVDYVVAVSFVEALARRGIDPMSSFLRQVLVKEQPLEFAYGFITRVASQLAQHEAGIRLADIFIEVGNIGLSASADVHAWRAGKPVLPIASTGGDARRLHEVLVRDWDQFPNPSLTREDFEKLSESLGDGSVLRNLLRLAFRREPAPSPVQPAAEKRKPRAWVVVAGSAVLLPDPAIGLVSWCQLVGRVLAEEGYGLMTGGWHGVDSTVLLEFARVLTEQGLPLEGFLCQVLYPAQENRHELGRIVRIQSAAEWHEMMLRTANAIILIEGGDQTVNLGRAATKAGKAVLPLVTTGGSAAELFHNIEANWERSPVPGLTLEDFQSLANLTDRELKRLLGLTLSPQSQPPALAGVPPMLPDFWVLVAGTIQHHLREAPLKAAQLVGRVLSTEGFGLITGGWPGVDREVMSTLLGTLERRGGQNPSWMVRQVLHEDQQIGNDFRSRTRLIRVPHSTAQLERCVELASAVILIGGDATATAYVHAIAGKARLARKPILPLPASSGDAEGLFHEMLTRWDKHPVSGLTQQDFQSLADADEGTLRRLLRQVRETSAPVPAEEKLAQEKEPPFWVWVAGSSGPVLAPKLLQMCRTVGQTLAREGFGLMTGGASGVDYEVAVEYANTLRSLGAMRVEKAFRQFPSNELLGNWRNARLSEGQVISRPDTEYRVITEPVGTLILLSGEGRTRLLALAALQRSIPVLPLPAAGGYAGVLHQERLKSGRLSAPISSADFARLAQPLGDGSELARLLQQIASQRIESPPTSEEEKPAEASAGAEAVEDEVEVPTPEVSTPAEVPEPTFWVWVSGSRWVSDSDREAALVVARLLSEEGCGLITCGRYGIDEIVAESFSFAVQQQHGQDGVRRYLRLVFGTEEQKTVEGGAVIQAGTNEEQLTLCAQQADAVILIGGVNGPISVTEAAQSANKSVLPLASTGGAAEEMFNRLVSWRERGEGNQYPLTA